MSKRRIIVISGLFVLFLFCFNSSVLASQYTVKKGESLFDISKKLGVSVEKIKKANHLSGNKIKPGQVLSLKKKSSASPVLAKTKSQPASQYKIKKGDTLSAISKKTGVPVKQIVALNRVNSKSLRAGRSLILSKPNRTAAAASPSTVDENVDLSEEEEELIVSGTSSDVECETAESKEFLGKWGSADERKLFIKVATGFLGAPYRFGGVTIKGIDCSAFVRKMYEFFNITLPRTASEQSRVGVRVARNELEAGDLVFFRTKRPIGHVGIYIGNNEFVHASYSAKSVRIDSLDKPYFQQRFQRAVRVKDLAGNDSI